MKKYTFVMTCEAHEAGESYTALVEAENDLTAARKAQTELAAAFLEDGVTPGKVNILVVFNGHPEINGWGWVTGQYE